MKKVLVMLLMFGATAGFAQDQQEIINRLTPVCHGIDSTKSIESWKSKLAIIQAVQAANGDNWIPAYYNAYVSIQLSYSETNAEIRELYVDAAEGLMPQIEAGCKLMDEIHIMKALIANARMAIDPQSRWKEFGKIFDENLAKAKTINENNPHIYLLKAMSVYYTPKMFGGGAKNAKPYFIKANDKFALLTNKSIETPYWGEFLSAFMLTECEK